MSGGGGGSWSPNLPADAVLAGAKPQGTDNGAGGSVHVSAPATCLSDKNGNEAGNLCNDGTLKGAATSRAADSAQQRSKLEMPQQQPLAPQPQQEPTNQPAGKVCFADASASRQQ